jgi:hypothetical protein
VIRLQECRRCIQLHDDERGIVAELAERSCGAVGKVDVPELPAGARLATSGDLSCVVREPVGVVVEPEPAVVVEPGFVAGSVVGAVQAGAGL